MAPGEMSDPFRPRVAVMEADRLLRTLLVRLLDGAGFDSLAVEGRGDAAAIADSGALLLVVDGDGFAQAVPTLPALPTLLLSSAEEEAAALGRPCRIVAKPLLICEFLGALAELTGASKAGPLLAGPWWPRRTPAGRRVRPGEERVR